MQTPDLSQKAALLRGSSHFVGNTNQGAMSEKQAIFLALCGKKPVSAATTSVWAEHDGGRRSAPDDEAAVGGLLTELGLRFQLSSDEYATDAVVSLDSDLLQRYAATQDGSKWAQLYGYPVTAIEAFGTEQMMDPDEQDRLMAAAGLVPFMPVFRLSKAHAATEIKTLIDWSETLKRYGLV